MIDASLTLEKRIEQARRADRYHAFMHGFKDGASMKPMNDNFMKHPRRPDMSCAYSYGYERGRRLRQVTALEVQQLFNYKPSILRTSTTQEATL